VRQNFQPAVGWCEGAAKRPWFGLPVYRPATHQYPALPKPNSRPLRPHLHLRQVQVLRSLCETKFQPKPERNCSELFQQNKNKSGQPHQPASEFTYHAPIQKHTGTGLPVPVLYQSIFQAVLKRRSSSAAASSSPRAIPGISSGTAGFNPRGGDR